ncbi:transcription factor Opi1-domain-containing protein [Apiospora phragmitis]|uniref:Transcription factor Opi1-domain-containing protein n=1 Tax=Apiospora phragmitis TaxID=2905665 RepID=A0ABR1T4F4_9PEZI
MEQNHMLPRPANTVDFTSTTAATHHPLDQKPAILQQNHRQQTPSTDPAAFKTFDRTFKLPLYPPPSYAQTHHHDHKALVFPDAPKTELAPIHTFTGIANDDKKKHTLPSLSSLTASSSPPYTSSLAQSNPSIPPAPTYNPPAPPLSATASASSSTSITVPLRPQETHWPSLNPLTAYYAPSHVQGAEPMQMEGDSTNSSVSSAASPEQYETGRASSVSLDDPDVRLAAEALGDLRADFVSSPPDQSTPLPSTPRSQSNAPPEPLLQLLTTNHPLLGNVIEGTQSAYVAGKNYSPRFKSGAEYVEGYVTPIANTVGTVGRKTGVEGSVRWFLGKGRRHKSHGSDLEAGDYGTSNKRRRVDAGSEAIMDQDEHMSGTSTPRATSDPHDRRLSVASTIDTLPAYDEYRSPAYTEQSAPRPTSASAWQSRLIMSTSGLSIAMSEESLMSLKYCLSWLRWANVHIGNVISSLKSVMDRSASDMTMEGSSAVNSVEQQQMAARINALRVDVLKTLQGVISTVSKYAGGALPDNARILVRRHLTSLPQRFRIASMAEDDQRTNQQGEMSTEEAGIAKEKEMREGVQKVLVLAKEGLDMMAQVSGVLDGTIVSAEEWCERLGRKRRQQREELLEGPRLPQFPVYDGKMDVKMVDQ